MNAQDILKELRKHHNQKNIDGMHRFAIPGEIGISIYFLRDIAKQYKNNHKRATDLWKTNVHEARLLACFVEDPEQVTEKQMERWVKDFKSWDLCDQACSTIFDKTPWAWEKPFEWAERDEEFVKRAGFVIIPCLATHDKKTPDKRFLDFFPLIEKHSYDERNFVKKAVNWALRGIGKRSLFLNKKAIALAKKIEKQETKAARWIAKNALRELQSEKVQKRLEKL